MKTRGTVFAALAAAGVVLLAGCGQGASESTEALGNAKAGLLSSMDLTFGKAKDNNAPPNTGDFFKGSSDDPAAMKWVQLSAGAAGNLNPVVVNGAGFTLYRFDKDTVNPSKSNCKDECAKTWPPVLVNPDGRIFLDGVPKEKVGVVKRDDGKLQVTVGGWPVYRFSKDTAPGQTNGQGVGGTWFGVTPDGGKAGQAPQGVNPETGMNYVNGTAQSNGAPPNTGDFYTEDRTSPIATKWVQLTAGTANGLNPIVHDAAGFTLYRFDNDTPNPSKSNCNDDCAGTWPPVLVQPGSRIFVNGVPTAQVGIITRDDGTRQVTLGGWPIYRFSKDTAPGQTNGQGVGGTWFAVSPLGGKVAPAVTSADGS